MSVMTKNQVENLFNRLRRIEDPETPALKASDTRIVGNYLRDLNVEDPGPTTEDGLKAKEIEARLENEEMDVLKRLALTQELVSLRNPPKLSRIRELSFIQVAKRYSDRYGISKAAWIEVGVPESLMRRVGVR